MKFLSLIDLDTVFPYIVSAEPILFLDFEIVANSNICRDISFFTLINWIFGLETIQGRKLLIIRRFYLRKLFKGGNYSRKETIWGNTVCFYGRKCSFRRETRKLKYLGNGNAAVCGYNSFRLLPLRSAWRICRDLRPNNMCARQYINVSKYSFTPYQ